MQACNNHSRQGQGNSVLTTMIVFSLLLHCLLIFALADVYRPPRMETIELTWQELPPRSDHGRFVSRPVVEKQKKPAVLASTMQKQKPPAAKKIAEIEPPMKKKVVEKDQVPEAEPLSQVESMAEIKTPPIGEKIPEHRSETDSASVEPARQIPDIIREDGGASPPAMEVPAVNSLPDKQVVDNYLSFLRARIEQHKKYPLVARRRGLEGEVGLRFILAATGEVLKLEVLKSSGVVILDRAAVDAVRRATPFAEPPEGFIDGTLPVELTIVFRLG